MIVNPSVRCLFNKGQRKAYEENICRMTFYDDDDDDDDATYWSWALIAFIFCGVIGFLFLLYALIRCVTQVAQIIFPIYQIVKARS